jgi:leucyl aminopeptidase
MTKTQLQRESVYEAAYKGNIGMMEMMKFDCGGAAAVFGKTLTACVGWLHFKVLISCV